MKNVFNQNDVKEFIGRINTLTPATQAKWGKMSVGQMLAHLCVSYEMMYENKHPKPNAALKLFLKLLVKKSVVNEVPYKHSLRTAPAFVITEQKDFEKKKKRLIAYINKTLDLGEKHFDNKESHSFGALTKTEWNNMLSKHLDHHLSQFGV